MSTETAVQNADAQAKPAARWEDFIDIYFSPRALFERRANDSWAVPMIVLAVLVTIVYYAFLPVNRVVMESAMLSNPNLTEAQRSQATNMSGTMQLIGGIFVPITMTIMTLLIGFFAWLAGKMTSIDLPFRRALMISAFMGFLIFVQQVASYLMLSLKLRGNGEINLFRDGSLGVLRFIDIQGMNPGLVALLTRLDLFALWQLSWFAIAFMAAAKASKGSAWIAATVVWLVAAIPVVFQAMSAVR